MCENDLLSFFNLFWIGIKVVKLWLSTKEKKVCVYTYIYMRIYEGICCIKILL